MTNFLLTFYNRRSVIKDFVVKQKRTTLIKLLFLLCLFVATTEGKTKLDKAFIKEVTKRHNEYRALHGVGKTCESKYKISKYAQKWANHLAETDTFEHRPDNKYGENLSWMSGDVTGADHVDNLFIEEESHYSDNGYYGTEPTLADFDNYGHFTQIVWKKTRKIGVGKSGNIVVINYKAKGNIIGSFAKNVRPPQS